MGPGADRRPGSGQAGRRDAWLVGRCAGLGGTPQWSVVKPLALSGLIRPQCSHGAGLHLRGSCARGRARLAAHLAGGRVPPTSEQMVGGLREVPAMLCPQAPPFIFCKTDNHSPQELPAGSVDTSLASCLATGSPAPCTHASSPPPHELGAWSRIHTAQRP